MMITKHYVGRIFWGVLHFSCTAGVICDFICFVFNACKFYLSYSVPRYCKIVLTVGGKSFFCIPSVSFDEHNKLFDLGW